MSSENLQECVQGHVYEGAEGDCPWCPAQEKDSVSQGAGAAGGKTVILGGEQNTHTDVTNKTHTASPTATNTNTPPDLGKTKITRPDDEGDNETTAAGTQNNTVQRRRLRGWLVTYDHADYGLDFKINEGSNSIGSQADNSITITDGSVSSKHAIILYRKGDFLISDEMSSNGTFLNGEELQPRIPSSLKDGDEVKVGDTTFLFRVSFKS